jgi:hypothetical protein
MFSCDENPLFKQLHWDILYLRAFSVEIPRLQIVKKHNAAGRYGPSCAWLSDDGKIGFVWLRSPEGNTGYRAAIGTYGYDRYDHGCDVVSFHLAGPSNLAPEIVTLPFVRASELQSLQGPT